MLIYELLYEKHDLAFQLDVGAVHVKFKLVPEQEDQMKKQGMSLPSEDTYCVYAYKLGYGNTDVMDQLKSRKGYSNDVASQERDLAQMIDNAIDGVWHAKDPKGKWEGTKEGVRQLQSFFNNGPKVIVVPAPSSSTTSQIVAQRVAAKTGARYVNAFSKVSHPPVSIRQIQRDYPDRDVSQIENPATFKQEMLDAEREMEKAIEQDDNRLFAHWEQQYEVLKKRYEQYKYQRKAYQYPHNAFIGKAIYNTVDATDQAKELHGAYVIIADDNVMQGHTISDTVKALWMKGIVPKRVIAFAPHRFVTTRS
jgi:hypothetical protein